MSVKWKKLVALLITGVMLLSDSNLSGFYTNSVSYAREYEEKTETVTEQTLENDSEESTTEFSESEPVEDELEPIPDELEDEETLLEEGEPEGEPEEPQNTVTKTRTYPAFSKVVTVGGFTIKIDAPEGLLPTDTIVTKDPEGNVIDTEVKESSVDVSLFNNMEYNSYDETLAYLLKYHAIEDIRGEILSSVGIDIQFHDGDGNLINPDQSGKVAVTVSLDSQFKEKLANNSNSTYAIEGAAYRMYADKNATLLSDTTINEARDELTFYIKASNKYAIAAIKYPSGNWDEKYDYIRYNNGNNLAIKTSYKYNLKVSLSWDDKGITTYRTNSVYVKIYAGDQKGNSGNPEDYLFAGNMTIDKTKTTNVLEFKNLPVYIDYNNRDTSSGGNGSWAMPAKFYHIDVEAPTGYTAVYSVINVSPEKDRNDKIWATTTVSESLKLEDMVNPVFTINWNDNRNNATQRPFEESNAVDDKAKECFELYYSIDGGEKRLVRQSSYFPNGTETKPSSIDVTGFMTWKVNYKNLPSKVQGKNVKYFIKIKDEFLALDEALLEKETEGTYSSNVEYVEASSNALLTYRADFNGTLIWNDGDSASIYRPDEVTLQLYKKGSLIDLPDDIVWEKSGNKWTFTIPDLPQYDETYNAIQYKINIENDIIETKIVDTHEYVVTYNNSPSSTIITECIDDGKIYATLSAELASMHCKKVWCDDYVEAAGDSEDNLLAINARKTAITKGIVLYLWRYPKKEGYTVADGAPVTKGGNQLFYQLTNDESSKNYLDFDFDLSLFVDDGDALPFYNEEGYEYVYYVTEVSESNDYKAAYTNTDSSIKKACLNNGSIRNVRSEQKRISYSKQWNSPVPEHYAGSTVTLALQRLEKNGEGQKVWKTVLEDELSNFSSSIKKRSSHFDEADLYDENGIRYEYRVIETKIVPASGTAINIDPDSYEKDSSGDWVAKYSISGATYEAITRYEEALDRYNVLNRMSDTIDLKLQINWLSNKIDWADYEKEDGTHKGVADKVIQTEFVIERDGEPYAVVKTYGTEPGIDGSGIDDFKTATVQYYTEGGILGEPTNVDMEFVDAGSGARWNLEAIQLPAMTEGGKAYSYTVKESVTGNTKVGEMMAPATFYTLYEYTSTSNNILAQVNNYVTKEGGESWTYISVTKEWLDDSANNRTPVTVTPVRINADGSYDYLVKDGNPNPVVKYVPSAEFEAGLLDGTYATNQLTYVRTLSDSNNWYQYFGFKTSDYAVTVGDEEKKQWAVVEILGNRVVNGLPDTIEGWNATAIEGNIPAVVEEDVIKNSYDVTINKAAGLNATSYRIVNKRTGLMRLNVKKHWYDGSNHLNDRQDKFRLEAIQYLDGVETDAFYCVIDETTQDEDEIVFPGGNTKRITPLGDEDITEIPLYDENGIAYEYEFKEYLIDTNGTDDPADDITTEIKLTDTKDTSPTGYVATFHHVDQEVDIHGGQYRVTDFYEYDNSLMGIRKHPTVFYKIWKDKNIYEVNKRPDINFKLYYSLGEDGDLIAYDSDSSLPEYSVVWKTADIDDEGNSIANPYYQKAEFNGLPTGTYVNGEYKLYYYYVLESFTGDASSYLSDAYVDGKIEKISDDMTDKVLRYDIGADAVKSTKKVGSTDVIPENGAFRNYADEEIIIKGSKTWINTDGFLSEMLPQANIYLWRESEHDKTNQEPNDTNGHGIQDNVNYVDEENTGVIHLKDDRTGYIFDGKKYPKYDKFGSLYTYSVTEQIVVANGNYGDEIPEFVMVDEENLLKVQNTYQKDNIFNKRRIRISKDWDVDPSYIVDSAKPYAKFELWQYETTDDINFANAAIDFTQAPYNTMTAIPSGAKRINATDGNTYQSIAYGAVDNSVIWEDLPIFAPSGHTYIYFVKELTDQGISSYKITNNAESTANGKTDSVNKKISDNIVLISNEGIDPGVQFTSGAITADYLNDSTVFSNSYKVDKTFKVIKGTKIWEEDEIYSDVTRPKVDAEASAKNSPEQNIKLKVTRSSTTQSGASNGISGEVIPEDKYDVVWTQATNETETPIENQWVYTITMHENEDLPQYSGNGQPFTYYVTEEYISNSMVADNYYIRVKSASRITVNTSNDKSNVVDGVLTMSGNLTNTLQGSLTIYKTWNDYNNEYGLRSNEIRGVLQYRKEGESSWIDYTGVGTDQNPDNMATISLEYSENAATNWARTITKLPVYWYNEDGSARAKYEYRFVEYYLVDNGVVEQIDYKDTSKIPDDYSGENYDATGHAYVIKLNGNHEILEPDPVTFSSGTGVVKRETTVYNELVSTSKTSLRIIKKWNDTSDVSEVRPTSISYVIQWRKENSALDNEWKNLKKSNGNDVIVQLTSTSAKADGTWQLVYPNLPKRGKNDTSDGYVNLEYRAIELGTNLGRYAGYVSASDEMLGQADANSTLGTNTDEETGVTEYKTDFNTADGLYETVLQNNLATRKFTVEKKWNDDQNHTEDVTISLLSRNFKKGVDDVSVPLEEIKNTERVITPVHDYKTTYENLPVYNEDHEKIVYYVVEKVIGDKDWQDTNYKVDGFSCLENSDYEEAGIYDYSVSKKVNVDGVDTNTTYKYKAIRMLDDNAQSDATVVIVNTPYTDVKVTKNWDDENNRDHRRTSVQATLYTVKPAAGGAAEGEPSKVVVDAAGENITNPETLTVEDGNSIVWEKLPAFEPITPEEIGAYESGNGTPYLYQVKEATVGNYTTTYLTSDTDTANQELGRLSLVIPAEDATEIPNTVTIENHYQPKKVTVSADVLWEDNNNLYSTRPNTVTLALYYRVGTTGNWIKLDQSTKTDYEDYQDGKKVYTTSAVAQTFTKDSEDVDDSNQWTHGTPAATPDIAKWEDLPVFVLVYNSTTEKYDTKPVYYKVMETSASPAATIANNGEPKTSVKGYTTTYEGDLYGSVFGNASNYAYIQDEDNQIIVNKITGMINLKVTKTWSGDASTDGVVTDKVRPNSVTFGVEYKHGASSWTTLKDATDSTKDVLLVANAGNNWTVTSGLIPKVDGAGNDYQYRLVEKYITYIVNGQEIKVNGNGSFDPANETKWTGTVGAYSDTIEVTSVSDGTIGFEASATNKLVSKNLTAVKVWDDESDRDGLRKKSITISLYRDGEKYGDSVTIGYDADGNLLTGTTVDATNNEWSYTFKNLPVFKNQASTQEAPSSSTLSSYYIVEESTVDSYDTTYGQARDSIVKSTASSSQVTLVNAASQPADNSIYVKNKYVPTRFKLDAVKTWSDFNNQYGYRPTTVSVKLQYRLEGEGADAPWKDVSHVDAVSLLDASGKVVETTSDVTQVLKKLATDTNNNIWHAKGWENLPAYVKDASGVSKKVIYRVKEIETVAVTTHYEILDTETYTYDSSDTQAIINVENDVSGDYSLKVKKVWVEKDSLALYNALPKKVGVHIEYSHDDGANWNQIEGSVGKYELVANSTVIGEQSWTHTFINLNKDYIYRVLEDYIVYVDDDNVEHKVDVTADTTDPTMGTVGNFSYTYENEEMLTTSETDIITNDRPDKKITISKVWKDEENRDQLRPSEVTVNLVRDGEKVDSVVLDEGNNWTYTWDYLPIYQNGKPAAEQNLSIYEVEEEEVDAYEVLYKVNDGNYEEENQISFAMDDAEEEHTITIKNTHSVENTKIVASKNWIDDENKCGSRPESIHLTLLYKYVEEDDTAWRTVTHYDLTDYEAANQYPDSKVYTTSDIEQEVTGNDSERWEDVATWENLSVYGNDNGDAINLKQIMYKVVESAGDYNEADGSYSESIPTGYEVIYDTAITASVEEQIPYEVTNTLITTKLEVAKYFDDYENIYGTRPDAIEVALQRRVIAGPDDPVNTWEKVSEKGILLNHAVTIRLEPEDGVWAGVFENLPVYAENGERYEYRGIETKLIYGNKKVSINEEVYTEESPIETRIGAYVSSGNSDSVESLPYDTYKTTLENKLQVTSLSISKEFDDQDNLYETRPSKIEFKVQRRASKNIVTDIIYNIVEWFGVDVGYDDVIIQTSSGEEVLTVTMNGPSFDTVTIDNLPKFDEEGHMYEYRGREYKLYYGSEEVLIDADTCPYEVASNMDEKKNVSDSEEEHYEFTSVVTNKLKTSDIDVTKKWDDKDNQYKSRPENIQLTLYNQEGVVEVHQDYEWEKSGNTWKCSITDLPVMIPGTITKAEYYFEEAIVQNYEEQKELSVENGKVVITNTLDESNYQTGNGAGATTNSHKTGDRPYMPIAIIGLLISLAASMILYRKKCRMK